MPLRGIGRDEYQFDDDRPLSRRRVFLLGLGEVFHPLKFPEPVLLPTAVPLPVAYRLKAVVST